MARQYRQTATRTSVRTGTYCYADGLRNICFQCNRVRHKRRQCPMLMTNEPHKTAAMQQMTANSARISVMTLVERVKLNLLVAI